MRLPGSLRWVSGFNAVLERLPGPVWAVAGAVLALAFLLLACRGAPVGTAVADDYAYLGKLLFAGKIDLFDSMGSPFYWRPLSRQVYFSAVGPWLRVAPWGAVALHATMLLLIYAVIYRTARRIFSPPVAAAMAGFPLLAEPTRVLLAWPSGAHYLLLLLAAAAALAAGFAGKRLPAALAAGAALLAHESGLLVLAALPVAAYFHSHERRRVQSWALLAVVIGVAWAAGIGVARAHGVSWPAGGDAAVSAWSSAPRVLMESLSAQLNFEDLRGVDRIILLSSYGVLILAALVAAAEAGARARLRRQAPLLLGGLIWFVAGSLPQVVVPPWNSWRTTLPALGLGVAATSAAGALHPGLAVGLAASRGLGLLLAEPAPTVVATEPPSSASQISFTRLARLQRTVRATERALLGRHAELPPGADVRYWAMPRMTELAFLGQAAPRVWYGDSTLTWLGFGGDQGFRRRPPDAIVQFSPDRRDSELAVVIEPEAFRFYAGARIAFNNEQDRLADSLFTRAARAQPRLAPEYLACVARDQARLAYNQGELARADSLNQLDLRYGGETPYHAALAAHIAYQRGDRGAARRWLRVCLSLDPNHPEGRQLAQAMGLTPIFADPGAEGRALPPGP